MSSYWKFGLCSLIWQSKKGKGSFNDPFNSIDERMKSVGNEGRPVKLLTNHFDMRLNLATVVRYDVEMSLIFGEDRSRAPRKKDMDILIRAFEGGPAFGIAQLISSTLWLLSSLGSLLNAHCLRLDLA